LIKAQVIDVSDWTWFDQDTFENILCKNNGDTVEASENYH